MVYDPRHDDRDYEKESRQENRLLWKVVDGIEQVAKKAGIPVNWTSDYYDFIVVGNYEMEQSVFGSHDFKCVKIQPHSSDDMSKFALCFEEAEEAMGFFEAHFNAIQEKMPVMSV